MAITILTGAGASKPLGYPMTTEFFPPASQFDKGQQEVWKHLTAYFAESVLDVEDVLSLVQPVETFLESRPGEFFGRAVGGPWKTQVRSFARYARERCFELYGALPDSKDVEKIYEPLLQLCRWESQGISLFTTNYDPVTDKILDLADLRNIRAYDGFKARGQWDPAGYREKRTGLDVYRLHGSMSWIRQQDTIQNTRDYSLRRGETEYLLIYPGYKGNPESSGEEAYALPHKMLRSDLEESQFFVVIGFSFRDKHLNQVISDSLAKNSKLRLVVVNPDWPEAAVRWSTKYSASDPERVIHISSKFGEDETIQALARVLGET